MVRCHDINGQHNNNSGISTGELIETWYDLSGNENHVSQTNNNKTSIHIGIRLPTLVESDEMNTNFSLYNLGHGDGNGLQF